MENCPLCYTENFEADVKGPIGRFFHLCDNCQLVFENKINHPDRNEEIGRYLEHNNGIQYEEYVKHLNRAIKPATKYLQTGSRGLDFGCGPVPTLNVLIEREGFTCEFYDPIFFTEPPSGNFDFIFATECFEHFFRPAHELQKIDGLLNPEGILVVMTHLWNNTTRFKGWGYAHDPTHVVFYHENTFRFIARHFGFEILEIKKGRVIILQKKNGL